MLRNLRLPLFSSLLLPLVIMLMAPAHADQHKLPDPTADDFCKVVQKIMANTSMASENTLFDNMPDYRASKPMVDPLQTFQVVTYDGKRPIVVSCKVKGAAHIRSAHGDDAAGKQLFCPSITRMFRDQAIADLKTENRQDAIAKVEAFVIDDNEPYLTGRDYLSDFQLSYVGEDGAIHLNSPGLFHDYDSWTRWILPERFEGQVYCHLPTPAYIKALARGEVEPGTPITTADDAPTQPN